MKLQALRNALRDRPAVSGGLVAGCMLLAVCIQLYRCTGGITDSTPADGIYYYDLSAGKLFIAPGAQVLPLATAATPEPDNETGGVMAIVYGCGGCGSGHDTFIGYLVTHDQAVVRTLNPQWSVGAKLMALGENPNGVLVRPYSVEVNHPQGEWVPRRSPEGMRITQSVAASSPCPPGVKLTQCGP